MLTAKRRKVILELLDQEETVSLQSLVSALNASESTVRRDLSLLEAEGLLIRIHGGAKRVYAMDMESTVQEKMLRFPIEKECIGRYAGHLVQTDEVIFLDAGTTTSQVIPYLADKNVTVVTNGIYQATLLSEYGIRTILLGGKLKNATNAIIGPNAMQQLQQYRFNRAFLGMNGVDLQYGYTTPDEEEALIKRLALQQSTQTYILADNSKLTKVSFCKVAPISDAILITNASKEKNELRFREETTVLIAGTYQREEGEEQ